MKTPKPVKSPYLVSFDGSFKVKKAATQPTKRPTKKESKKSLEKSIRELRGLQRQLYADDRRALLLVFQAMDAAGKDGTIRAVMTGINPAGCQVFSFKRPSAEELDHDFMWRVYRRLPERGRIGIFNRSHYEEVLVVRVHPEYLNAQKLPEELLQSNVWKSRFKSIRAFERHCYENGTPILKFWLNVSRDEQRRRLIKRIDDPDANWKFEAGDLKERKLWEKYMKAYEDALNETSRPWAPWYAIPADDKPFMRAAVADIVVQTLKGMGARYPSLSQSEKQDLSGYRRQLEND